MLFINDTTEVLEILTTSVADIDYSITYSQLPSGVLSYFSAQGKINTAVTTFVKWENDDNSKKLITLFSIRNTHASLSNTVTVKKQIAGNTYSLTSDIILLAGEMVEYVDGNGWQVYDAAGLKKNDSAVSTTVKNITLVDEASATITYVGKALPGAVSSDPVWSIFRIDTSVSPLTDILYADGTAAYIKVWDNRASYTYS